MRRVVLGVMAVGLLAASAACGEGSRPRVASLQSGEPRPTATVRPVDQDEAFRAFAKCMREHGVEMPDPQVGEDGGLTIGLGGPPDSGGDVARAPAPPDGFEEAEKECRPLLPDLGSLLSPEDQSAMQDAMLAFTKCMREHGVDLPDPGAGGAVLRIDADDPDVQEAQQACEKHLADVPHAREGR